MVGFYVTGTYSYWLKFKFRYFKYLRSHCVEQRIEKKFIKIQHAVYTCFNVLAKSYGWFKTVHIIHVSPVAKLI